MTKIEKENITNQIMDLLIKLTEDSPKTETIQQSKPVEMLTIKECCNEVKGLSEHTVRQLVAQGKVKSVRTGEGKRGKILVNKADLIAYFNV